MAADPTPPPSRPVEGIALLPPRATQCFQHYAGGSEAQLHGAEHKGPSGEVQSLPRWLENGRVDSVVCVCARPRPRGSVKVPLIQIEPDMVVLKSMSAERRFPCEIPFGSSLFAALRSTRRVLHM
jgi:hypothetical protein